MTWTYDPTLAIARDQVRFYVSDTDANDPLLSDEEIDGVLTLAGGVRQAAIQCAQTLALTFSRKAQTVVDDLGATVTYGQRAADFRALVAQLRHDASMLATPTAGGLTYSSKQVAEQDTDRVRPAFKRGM